MYYPYVYIYLIFFNTAEVKLSSLIFPLENFLFVNKSIYLAFSGKVKNRLHIGFEDPSEATGSTEFIHSEFVRVRDEIKEAFYKLYIEKTKALESSYALEMQSTRIGKKRFSERLQSLYDNKLIELKKLGVLQALGIVEKYGGVLQREQKSRSEKKSVER